MGREQNQIWLHTTLGISTAASDAGRRTRDGLDWYIHTKSSPCIHLCRIACSLVASVSLVLALIPSWSRRTHTAFTWPSWKRSQKKIGSPVIPVIWRLLVSRLDHISCSTSRRIRGSTTTRSSSNRKRRPLELKTPACGIGPIPGAGDKDDSALCVYALFASRDHPPTPTLRQVSSSWTLGPLSTGQRQSFHPSSQPDASRRDCSPLPTLSQLFFAMDIDQPEPFPAQPRATSSASASSSSSVVKPKKFKLDPMSLLLPHERHLYTQSAPPGAMSSSSSSVDPGSAPERGGPGGKHGEAFQPTRQQLQQQGGGRPTGGRQTSSMGEQSGRQGEPPARE